MGMYRYFLNHVETAIFFWGGAFFISINLTMCNLSEELLEQFTTHIELFDSILL